jgi:RNase P subunit RPR2
MKAQHARDKAWVHRHVVPTNIRCGFCDAKGRPLLQGQAVDLRQGAENLLKRCEECSGTLRVPIPFEEVWGIK